MHSTIAKLFAVVVAGLTPALAETIHGVALFTRHGDRMFPALAPRLR